MTTNTMVAIQTVTLGSSQSSITFGTGGTIPQTYTDLMIVCSPTNNQSINTADLTLNFNGDTTSGLYSRTVLMANGSSAISSRTSGNNIMYLTFYAAPSSGNPSTWIVNVQNYANATTYKTVLARGNNAASGIDATVGLWRNINAITSILVSNTVGTFSAGSTFTLYGIANADIGAYATGGIITQDSTYYYHAFGSSGTFTPSRALTADILVVAGGGGGGGTTGGGGGAGGLLFAGAQSLASGTGYTCTIGGPGAAGTSNNSGGNGANSSLIGGSISQTAIGGGGGGGYNTWYGSSGGSGGGGDNDGSHTSAAGGSPTSGQGYAGGNGNNGTGDLNGGGGGAGGSGNNGSSAGSGAGGVGSSSYSLWLQTTGLGQNVNGTYYIAGGGGGGANVYAGAAGGYGGGGAGATGGSVGSNATVNTGGGGGGGGGAGAHNGGAGGSGLIIVRYAK